MAATGPTRSGFEPSEWKEVRGEATALLQTLLRIDTTNPPGNETQAARVLQEVLAADGLESELLESVPGRGNLVCRLECCPEGDRPAEPPLLLATHLDVVPAGDPGRWTRAPFSGDLHGGLIWGRGAVDMKNMVAMSAMVIKLLRRREARLRRDVIFVAVADEEAGCTHGSRFLVENHPDRVRAGYALGEVGGYPVTIGRARVMLVQTAEKGLCWLRVTARGPAGHGSMPRPDSAVVRLARALARLGQRSLPQHNTPPVEAFIRQVASLQPLPHRLVLPRLLNPRLSGPILDRLFPDRSKAANLRALLHNTVAPTVLRAGEATNVIPDEAVAELDGRTLPGQRPEDLIRELRELCGDELELEFEVLREAPGAVNYPPDSPLWDCIRSVVRRHDRGLTVVPYMIPGFTDAKYFGLLGARWYGFAPVRLDPESGLSFGDLFHGVDERIPEDGFHWGLQALHEVVESFCVRG
jgi:acetylornithine deacetylase/succinyl-diaminopimelate desuccinylase-like protein